MTLFKQLFWGTSIAFLGILLATETVYIHNAHKYLREQLASHAQDAATSLGMVLPEAMDRKDVILTEVTVNAMFDRGYYESIRVLNTRGETLVLKTLPAAPAEVPQWFVDRFPLDSPYAESLISKGWRQLGRVVVTNHPNFAYKQLWWTLLEVTLGVALLYVLVLVALYGFLTRILKPLRDIEAVAHAISERDFQLIRLIPRAREMRNVVNAINSMSEKLRGIIEFEVQQAKRFRDESTKDVLTGLENRRGLELYVEALFEEKKDLVSGTMFMLRIDDFQGYNRRYGYREGDTMLKEVAAALRSVWQDRDLLRSVDNGATFFLVAPNISRDEAEQLGRALMLAVSAVIEASLDEIPVNFGSGAVFFSGQSATLGSLLAQCDLAMLQSLNQGKSQCVLSNLANDNQGKGSQYWKQLILDTISARRIILFAQPVMSLRTAEQIQIEVIGRLKNENGELIPAEQFIPMANRHGLTPAFDLHVLQKLLGAMTSGKVTDNEVAINLSVRSVHDAGLLEWLDDWMRSNPILSRRLVFEFTEFGIVQDGEGVARFVHDIRELGADFAVDNFGLHQSAFDYLQHLKPRYVKLSPTFIRDLSNNQKHQFFISSVVMITRPLEVRVIAMGVEDASGLELLDNLGVDGYQGFVTGKMFELD